MTADIFKLSDYRTPDIDCEIDLVTAADVAIRDLREILLYWGTERARQRAQECELMLRHALSGTINCGPDSLL
jgi:hypothetical protein